MVIAPDALATDAYGVSRRTVEGHDCEFPVAGCGNHYSPGFGCFTLETNLDHLIGQVSREGAIEDGESALRWRWKMRHLKVEALYAKDISGIVPTEKSKRKFRLPG